MRVLPSTLRGRVAVAAALASLVALGALGTAGTLLVDHELRSSLDRTLRQQAADVARLSATAPALVTDATAIGGVSGTAEASVEVVDRHGRIVSRSTALGARVLPTSLARRAIEQGSAGFVPAPAEDPGLRVYVAPLSDAGGPAAGGAVIVAASTDELDRTLHRLRSLFVIATLASAAAAAAAAALLARRATGPLDRLARAAGEIERTSDATRRLPVEPSTREVDRLALTLNAMLAALERARASERRFVDDASHELRTPVTALRGNVDYVARHGADPAAVADLVADAERLSRLLDDLLTLAREDAGGAQVEQLDLARLVADACRDDPLVDLDAPEPVPVRADALALERVVQNLVDNAHLHGPAEGRVAVAVRREGASAVVTVIDEGEGVAPADREHVFERFWQRSGSRGSGLGLAIVRQVAERHGGRASVDGAAFRVELPVDRSAGAARPSPAKL
jgi:signal transduction histidine kinase